jgi:hypothetical protein
MALAESAANLVIGYGASVALSWWLFGVTPGHAAGASVVFTVASLTRSYGVRRLFTRWD